MEALLVLVILTLGSSVVPHKSAGPGLAVVRFKAAANQEQPQSKAEDEAPETRQTRRSSAQPTPPQATPAPREPKPEATPPPLIRLSPAEMARLDIAALPRPVRSPRAVMGPPDTAPPLRDTPRVSGSGPDGQPLYAASWYREPYDDELRGYLSTATGPGWGLIACRTAPDFRVEDCVKVDEYPTGSNIARSVLAAAWQFRVRPPRIGGEPKIGEWVRIRIDYDFAARSPP